MAGTEMQTVRIFRIAGASSSGGRLVLDDGHARWDLSRFLRRQGQPNDLVDLCEDGWFDLRRLEKRLPGASPDDDWQRLEDSGDANAPEGVGTPFTTAQVGKVLALGKNFREHAEEFGETVPEELLFFNKLPETLTPHRATVTVASWYTARVDHEAELAVVIGLGGRDVRVDDAMEHVAGYTVANDLTARSLQGQDRERRHPWFRAKNMDGFLPLGPCFVPRDFLDLGDLDVTAEVNGELRQKASTRALVVDVPHALAALSRHLTLRPGDVVLMGTPAGVGPLEDGDEVVCRVDGIGELATRIARPAAGGAELA